MRIGLQLFASRRAGETARDALNRLTWQAGIADELGYDIVWLAEHHRTDWNVCPDPLTLAAHLASRTDKIRIGTGVVNLGLHHPVEVAERACMVDDLSDGRLELGLGRGFSPFDYELYGVDPDEAKRRYADSVRLVCNQVRETLGADGIPLWLSTTGTPATIELAAHLDCGLLLSASGSKLAETVDRFRGLGSSQGRIALARAVHIASDTDTAWTELEPYLAWYRDRLAALQPGHEAPELDEVRNTFCVVGTAQDVAVRVSQMQTMHQLTDIAAVVGIAGMADGMFAGVTRDLISALRVQQAVGASE